MRLIYKITDILHEAGKIVTSAKNITDNMTVKTGTANFATVYDLDVQKFLYARLSLLLPDASFIGEESADNHSELLTEGLSFIIDPIDGTTNFMHGYRHSAISVGLCRDGIMSSGAVYNPYLDEMFYAVRGEGAFLGKNRIYAGDNHLQNSLVSFGTTPYRRENADLTFDLVKKLFLASRDIRRSGSAALDLCYIACGRCGLFFESSLSPWDYAAGSLIVEESGGIISCLEQKPLPLDASSSVVAANRNAYKDFYRDIKTDLEFTALKGE